LPWEPHYAGAPLRGQLTGQRKIDKHKIDIMPKLVIAGIAHELAEQTITIGRAPDNAIIIDDPSVSGRHAHLELSGETYRLKDLESTNGTRVNGVPITETTLRFDDRIRFGAIDARFEPDARGSQPLPDVEQVEARPAEMSAAPVDFANASPFPGRRKDRDPTRTAIFAAAAIAALAFLVSMIAVLTMHAPMF
jgi:predicted component of type VI protein secretion system